MILSKPKFVPSVAKSDISNASAYILHNRLVYGCKINCNFEGLFISIYSEIDFRAMRLFKDILNDY